MLDGSSPEEVAGRLHSAAIHLLRRARREDEASGLSAARLSALSVVVFAGPVSIGRLARLEQVRSPTMSRMVADLEARGLVTREISGDDRRAVEVRATPEGRRILDEGRRRRVASLASHLAGLPAEDLAVLARAAQVLETVLDRT